MEGNFESRVAGYRQRVETFMARHLPSGNRTPDDLLAALQYATAGEGKRIRPLLVFATGELLDIRPDTLDYPAAAVEWIHTYSLIHDDLPAMDDDDLRRGRPTVHKQFDEATAILTGDALQTLAFELLANAKVDATLRCRWIGLLASAAGPEGMIGGQSMDLNPASILALEQLETMHRKKAGALITASIDLAMAASPELAEAHRSSLLAFAGNIGMAFQIHDDVLDVESTTQEMGKPQGSDQRQGRSTYVSLLGLGEAKKRVDLHYTRAREALSSFGTRAEGLLWLAEYIVRRSH